MQIEPFQGEPQLLDAKLKILLPPVVDAYLSFLTLSTRQSSKHLDTETGVCSILYTLCKVRGAKVVVGFFNNEPRYLEPILEALERVVSASDGGTEWQVPYVLLLWLSHLLLTPFDLTSISNKAGPIKLEDQWPSAPKDLPSLTARVLTVGLAFLHSPTKAQDAAAAMLVRLTIRPDVQRFRLADALAKERLPTLQSCEGSQNMYSILGSLRFVAGVASSAELNHLVPDIYRACQKAFDEDDDSSLSANAVTKKIMIKIFRNIAILSLRSAAADGPLLPFLQTSDVLESVIDYLLRSLADKDTPVRYAAAKAISLIILELEPAMGHEVIQAILDTFKEDIPRHATTVDLAAANPLKWHGLTLALSHCLFKRSASTEQLPGILDALITALQFQQRTATGSALGTNVRDAANFGIWSLARRYTTTELLPVQIHSLHMSVRTTQDVSIIQHLATQLILTACLDPAGNIRRGASAALQELVGRHPDQVHAGIALVQIVDYLAVSLRGRAMIQVANGAASLHQMYLEAILDGLFGWRGLGSADVSSRESAAASIADLSASVEGSIKSSSAMPRFIAAVEACPTHEVEALHGLCFTAARLLQRLNEGAASSNLMLEEDALAFIPFFKTLRSALTDFSPRVLRSEFPASLGLFAARLCRALSNVALSQTASGSRKETIPFDDIDTLAERLLARQEDPILQVAPDLARSLFDFKREFSRDLACLEARSLSAKVSADGTKSTMHGSGRAIALGALAPLYGGQELSGEDAKSAISTLCALMDVTNVDWRIIGVKALQLVVRGVEAPENISKDSVDTICAAIHRGLNDYTIDERGDVGSLVRLQSITCTSDIFGIRSFQHHAETLDILNADIYRLSLEKLDRVRLLAAQCRRRYLGLEHAAIDTKGISSIKYLEAALRPLTTDALHSVQRSLLEGCISCAGVAGESLIQVSRQVLADLLHSTPTEHLHHLLTMYSSVLKGLLTETPNTQPALELLAFFLDMQLFRRLFDTDFKFRNLLSTVQKLHHKSNDVPKILAAVHVYVGLAEVPSVRYEVLKKLISMLKTNPYPRVRVSVAEALWQITAEEALKKVDWTRPAKENMNIIDDMGKAHLSS